MIASLPKPWRWVALACLSIPLSFGLEAIQLPAAFLLGPMIAGVTFGVAGAGIRTPRPGFIFAQSIVGCLVARAFTPSILASIAGDWMEMSVVVILTLAASALVGWLMTKLGTLPGTTAAWGSAPGAASAMVAMSEAYGADPRLVAFMQYIRVLIVVASASVVARILVAMSGAPIAHAVPEPSQQISILSLIETLALAGAGGYLGWRFKVPAGGMLVPMIAGTILHSMGLLVITLPAWLLAVAYTALGWYVGLGFNRDVLFSAFKALPQLLLATFLLILLCCLSAWMLTWMVHTDLLTAYLATTPGGLDSVAIIAIGSHADIPFILAIQTLRLFAVILTGPYIAKLISRYA
jgi:membrane AbrB-like protein